MALTPRLDQRQSQSLVMTPQLQQAIKLLQLSNLELAEFIEQELEQNPMLERDEIDQQVDQADPSPDDPRAQDDHEFDGDGGDAGTMSEAGVGELSETFSSTDRAPVGEDTGLADLDFGSDADVGPADGDMDVGLDDLYVNDGAGDAVEAIPEAGFEASLPTSVAGGFTDDLPGYEQVLTTELSLRDHLMEQLGMDMPDHVDRIIGAFLIDQLDDAGYLATDLATVAEALDCGEAHVEAVLGRLQQFDPPGIFARDLRECLALQLADLNRLDPAMATLLDNLDVLAKHDFKALVRLCCVDQEDIIEMVGEIRALNPKPALAFDGEIAQPIVPDVLMRQRSGGGWHIELNPDTLPRVLVNNQYFAEISSGTTSKQDKQYITEQYQSANWLVKSLHQRATTILKVAKEIIRQQDAFFAKGVQHLKPLVLRDIAEVIDMHESTVSRVTANKFMASPRGIYELKYFFTSSIASSDGSDALSAESVKHRIKALIEAETPKTVLSDDKIVDTLRDDGVDIARRTVAKYREALGIASSVQRRREKNASF